MYGLAAGGYMCPGVFLISTLLKVYTTLSRFFFFFGGAEACNPLFPSGSLDTHKNGIKRCLVIAWPMKILFRFLAAVAARYMFTARIERARERERERDGRGSPCSHG